MVNNYMIVNGELYHWGIKGMKWGVRRYQNEDGSLTEAGARRYNRDADEKGYNAEHWSGARYKITKNKNGEVKSKEKLKFDADRYVKEDRERTKKLTDESRGMATNLKSIVDKSIQKEKQNKPKLDLSNMTDQEMRNQINRAMLERQYNDMFAPQKSTKGREYVSDILDTAGGVLAVTSSALGIVLAVQQLRGKA